ncbi:MAG: V-type ATP synthase subunit I [Halobacteriales archaeon]|nr:V-type ATP synthase subunit I [Halobacteriales archaeon]
MLRPERMSRVSVTGTKRVMPDVIEAVHGLNLLHLSDYDGSWEGFENGDPLENAESVSEKLVTVRSIESILDISEEDAGPARIVTDDDLDDQLEEIRTEVNELDDRRNELRDELRAVEERLEAAEPFAALGLDLDLLSGYDSLSVRVGEGDPEAVERALLDADGITAVETFSADGVVAAFSYPADEDAIEEALVGVEFTALEIPDAEGDPETYLEELEHERERLESKLDTVQDELDDLKLDAAGFLLAAEETLAIEAQKKEAPLQFATTENAFVAEGWVPSDRYPELVSAVQDAVGDHVEIEELERADYEPPHDHGHGGDHGEGEEAVADGGSNVTMGGDEPPIIQDNPKFAKPFELLVETINRPQYWDLDPTVILFLTFPAFFGFMIGDLGYGALYLAIGYWLWSSFDSQGFRSLGGVAMWAGAFTMVFGILYGEIFGFHLIATHFWEGLLGLHGPPMHKGLQPADLKYAQTWIVTVLLAGLAHLSIGYIFGFVQLTQGHGLKDAILEKGSWLTLMLGVWIWIFSRQAAGAKPDFLFTVFGTGEKAAYALGFTGLAPSVGTGGLALAAIGFVLLLAGEGGRGLIEFLDVVVNVLSYARIAAVLLAKAGMAFVVNLLTFGVYVTGHGNKAEWHFGLGHMPHVGDMVHGHEVTGILFGGLFHGGIALVIVGLLVLVLGHLIVLGLGVTSAGLQALRLQYYEFFSKFYYEGGGGDAYEPFGRERRYTTEE